MKTILTLRLTAVLLSCLHVFAFAAAAAPGDLDPTFAGTGYVRQPSLNGTLDYLADSVVQADGRIVSIGAIDYDNGTGTVRNCGLMRHNADGTLDPTFDGDGRLIIQTGIEFNCSALAVQPDGRIVVAGFMNFFGNYDFVLYRLNPNGTPDASFDGDGQVTTDFFNSDLAYGVALQADGKIVAVGVSGNDIALARYNADGSLDASFDGDGRVVTDLAGGTDQARAIAVQADGKLVVGGNTPGVGGLNDFAVLRYNPDGSRDASFDGDGLATTNFVDNHDNVNALVIQPDGKIVAGGSVWTNSPAMGLVRYNPDGTLDTSFDGDGKQTFDSPSTWDNLSRLALQADGKLVVVGDDNNFISIIRYNANGTLDTTFGSGGRTLFNAGSTTNGKAVAVRNDGLIIAAGWGYSIGSAVGPRVDFVLARLLPGGALDTSFDGDGKVTSNMRGTRSQAKAVAVQPDGKVVAATQELVLNNTSSEYDFVVYRYNADGSPDVSFDGDGKAVVNVNFHDDPWAVAVQPDGKILVAGETTNAMSLFRLDPNGALDTSFDGDGKIAISGQLTPHFSAIALQPDGRIVVAGRDFWLGYEGTVYRFNADGSPDTTFNGTGRIRFDLAGDNDLAAVAVQPDGKIVGAGKCVVGTSRDFMIVRLNANGTFDTSFDGDGQLYVDFLGGDDYADSLVLQPNGRIVAGGASGTSGGTQAATYDSALVRVTPDGTLDASFDGDGKLRAGLSALFDTASTVFVQPDGKILTAGYATTWQNNDPFTIEDDFALARYNADGSADLTFGSGGRVLTDVSFNDRAVEAALDSSGRIVVAGESDATFTIARLLGGSTLISTRAPFDFDGDGKTDVSIFRSSNGEWWLRNSAGGTVTAAQFGSGTDRIEPGDYTGDGKTDVAIFRPSTGTWYILRSEDGSYYSIPFGISTDLPAPADYDADGKTDIAVFRPSTGVWYILKSTGGTDIVGFGTAGDVPVAADYDGDGRADIAIYRPSNGQWWIDRSSTGLIAATFGVSTDRPVPGDWTGDGRADVAFYRPSTGWWFVLRSEDGSFFSFPFGAAGDSPAPGDYDGDGRTDAAVFRPSNTNWYINRSTAGLLILQFGAAGDAPVPGAFVP